MNGIEQQASQGILSPNYDKDIREGFALEHVNKTLFNSSVIHYEALKDLIMNPDMIGRQVINSNTKRNTSGVNGNHINSYVGVSYVTLDNDRNGCDGKGGKYICGFILDELGLGIIRGCETPINGLKRMDFTRRDVNIMGLLTREEAATYILFWPRDENKAVGSILTKNGAGSIELYHNNNTINPIRKMIINRELKNYYENAVKDFSMGEEH